MNAAGIARHRQKRTSGRLMGALVDWVLAEHVLLIDSVIGWLLECFFDCSINRFVDVCIDGVLAWFTLLHGGGWVLVRWNENASSLHCTIMYTHIGRSCIEKKLAAMDRRIAMECQQGFERCMESWRLSKSHVFFGGKRDWNANI